LTVAQHELHPEPTERRTGQKQASSVQLAMAASTGAQADEQAPIANSGAPVGEPVGVKFSEAQIEDAWRSSDAEDVLTV
jgi:hypothetical protein